MSLFILFYTIVEVDNYLENRIDPITIIIINGFLFIPNWWWDFSDSDENL
jgi:hypothetical protein